MKIIIVDDEQMLRESLAQKLRQITRISQINTFDYPPVALAYAKDHPIDIAFLDIEMPEMTGIEMAKRLKILQPKINIIFVTGYPEYAVTAFDIDASDYLLKPVTVERIAAALKRLRHPFAASASRIRVQTFGKFEIFADNKPISFGRERAKEVLAYLINQKARGCRKRNYPPFCGRRAITAAGNSWIYKSLFLK